MKNLVKKLSFLLIVTLTVAFFPKFTFSFSDYDIEPYWEIASFVQGTSAYDYNKILASDEFAGRQSGTEGNNKAASWIQDEFRKMKLKPFDTEKNSYLQSFTVPYYDVISPFQFQYKINNKWIKPLHKSDFIVFPYCGSGKVKSNFVFAGYGITDSAKGYDDYQNTDVKGKIVVLFYQKPSFILENYDEFEPMQRIKNAEKHQAKAVIFIQKSNSIPVLNFEMKNATGRTSSLPTLFASNHFSEEILSLGHQSLSAIEKEIDQTQKPHSFSIPIETELEVHVLDEQRFTNNVIGYIPAVDPDIIDSVVIGAHFDHIGTDYIDNTIYTGANDNASGTACLLEIARNLTSQFCFPSVNIVFIAFSGEEEGLYGSYQYVENPLFPIKNIKAMINLDMVGTGTGDLLAGTSRIRYEELCDVIDSCSEFMDISIPIDSSLLYPGSDHYFFHQKNVPSVFFFKLNPEGIGGYHTLEDTIDSVDPANLEECSRLVTLVILTISEAAFVNMNTFPENKTFLNPYFYWESNSYLINDHDLMFTLQGKPIKISLDDSFKIFMPLQRGENIYHFEVKYKELTIKEVDYKFQSSADPNLRADFNQDQTINLTDLALLGRNYMKKAPMYHILSIYDLNSDEVINQDDFTMFLQYFDLSNNQKQRHQIIK